MIPTKRLEAIRMMALIHAQLPLDLQPYGLDDTIAMADELLNLAADREYVLTLLDTYRAGLEGRDAGAANELCAAIATVREILDGRS